MDLNDVCRKQGAVFRHFKLGKDGKPHYYRVMTLAIDATGGRNDEKVVVYKACYKVDGFIDTFVRDIGEFFGEVFDPISGRRVRRFGFVGYRVPEG